ncbi:probable RNA-directed DNA polymerase from transposon X-element [Bactrocera oleae]|uniref:probable RNA-directed DNA polymerase from transposon X-element n=1 Tax=Bactrocera oleae TaxID=104688 RepID=UPI00387E8FBA
MDSGNCTHSIYTDFSKAFDRVDYEILLDKLSKYGVAGRALAWIRTYLTGRRLQVRVDGHLSSEYEVISGVPQGSHLGPVLFNIFVNDIGNNFASDFLLYADDLQIFRPITWETDIIILQQDINILSGWCRVNKLDLNVNKCAAVSFARSHSPIRTSYKLDRLEIAEVENIKDLGIIVDNKLTFSHHADKITSKAFKALGFILRRGKDFKNPWTLIRLFKSLVLPILEYGSVIWSPYTNTTIDKVEKLQRKFCKSLAYKLSSPSHICTTDEVYQCYCINKLSSRRQVADLCFFYKVVNNITDAHEILNSFELAPAGLTLRRNRLLKTSKSKKKLCCPWSSE